MVFVCDINMEGYQHLEFNSAFLSTLEKVELDQVQYFGDFKQVQLLKVMEEFQGGRVRWNGIRVLRYERGNFFKKFLVEVINFCKILKLAKRKGANLVIFLSIFSNAHPFCCILNKVFFRKKIIHILHGELDSLVSEKIYKLNKHKFWTLLGLYLNNDDRNYNYIVLGERIKENLRNTLPSLGMSNIFSFDHPYIFHENQRERDADANGISMGYIGSVKASRGAFDYFQIVEKISNSVFAWDIKFKLVGHIKEPACILNDLVEYDPKCLSGELSSDEYSRQIGSLDYIVFTFPPDSYFLGASGAVFDSLKFKRPIISLSNSYFEYIFEKIGPIGYLFSDKEAMISGIQKINFSKDSDQYREFINNIEKGREVFSSKSLDVDLNRILSEVRFA